MERLRLNFLDNLPKVTQLVSGRATLQSVWLQTMLSWGEGSWTWAYFSLPAHRSKPTGSYSDDRNKAWPQSPAIQLHNPSTPTLSQKDNNVNILILPSSLSLCNRLLASPGKENGWVHSKHPRVGARSCVFPTASDPSNWDMSLLPLSCDPFQNSYYNRSKNLLGFRDVFQTGFLCPEPRRWREHHLVQGTQNTWVQTGSAAISSQAVLSKLLLPFQASVFSCKTQ